MDAVHAESARALSFCRVEESRLDAARERVAKAVESIGAASAVRAFSLAVFAINDDVPVLN